MSLGGYMFEGRFCQKGSLTDVQWYHLLHATRVAAFMAANTRANAGWEYDMAGSSDGNIHCLDAVGNNYVTCFKNTAKGTYFALYTLCKATNTGTDSGSVQVYNESGAYNGSTVYLGVNCSCFYTVSKTHIAYDGKPGMNAMGIIPVGNTGTGSQLGSGYTNISDTYAGISSVNVKFGFAIKGDDIIAIQSYGTNSSTICISIISCSGFSSFVNANDTQGVFCLNTQKVISSSSGDIEYRSRNYDPAKLEMQLCISQYYNGNFYQFSQLGFTPLTRYSGNMQEYPFESLCLYDVANIQTNVSGKGTLKIDLISVNCPGANNNIVPNIWSSVAGGNYLTIRTLSGTNYYTFNKVNGYSGYSNATSNVAIYCGWDSSNPDITQESAWTEYTES